MINQFIALCFRRRHLVWVLTLLIVILVVYLTVSRCDVEEATPLDRTAAVSP